MKNFKSITTISFFLLTVLSLHAQNYPQWPADKPETGFIKDSQSREIRLGNDVLPQEVDMQDKMRSIFTDMVQNAAKKLSWQMVELSEYTNANPMQGGGTPYALRSPRGITITFQLIVNKDSLQAWKNYQMAYNNRYENNMQNGNNNVQSTAQSPLYKKYRDSANYYMQLYTNYCDEHKDEGADLYTKDKHPRYYQQKEMDFIDKANAMVEQAHDNAGIEEAEDQGEKDSYRFRNNTVVQVRFEVNAYVGIPFKDGGSDSPSGSGLPYPIAGTKISKLYTANVETADKWQNSLLILLGNFLNTKDKNGNFQAGFSQNGQGDEHTPKKIKSDKVQNISINIYGDKANIEKMAGLLNVAKLNGTIVKQ